MNREVHKKDAPRRYTSGGFSISPFLEFAIAERAAHAEPAHPFGGVRAAALTTGFNGTAAVDFRVEKRQRTPALILVSQRLHFFVD